MDEERRDNGAEWKRKRNLINAAEGLQLLKVIRIKKKKKETYSFGFGLDHFHECPPCSCLHQFRFGYFPGVQKLQLGQFVKNKVPVRNKQL